MRRSRRALLRVVEHAGCTRSSAAAAAVIPGNSSAWITPMNSSGTLVSTAAPAKPAAAAGSCG